MPHIHIQCNPVKKKVDDQIIEIPSRVALINSGPRIPVVAFQNGKIAEILMQKGEALPSPVSGWALIDTGASVSCIDDGIAQKLKLPVVDMVKMTSASHDGTECSVYPVRLEVQGVGLNMDIDRAVGANLQSQGLIALIGRDVLQLCTLYYNGHMGQITLSL